MIAADTSAFLAILFDEGERDTFLARLQAARRVSISSASLVEARMVVHDRRGETAVARLDTLFAQSNMRIVPVDEAMTALAHQAFVRYGKGSGHPAQMNFGDLFSYALAKSRGVPLLFKGDDFARTDIVSALA